MGLTCDCGDWCPEPGDWMYVEVGDYRPLRTKYSRRCCSCGEKIKPGETSAEAFRVRVPEFDIEIKIYGEDGEIPIASHFMCERCADLHWSLTDLGFCVSPGADQRELAHDYAEMYGRKSA